MNQNNKPRVLIDTSIFINAYFLINKNNQEKAIKIIEKYANSEEAFTSSQNLIEYTNFILSKSNINKKEVENQINELTTLFNIIECSKKSILPAINKYLKKNNSYLDALLAQTMLDNNINTIITENDKVFKRMKGIKAINPFK